MPEQPTRLISMGRPSLNIHKVRCRAILQLLDEGWKRASECPEVNPDAGEVEITERLRDSMREVLKGRVAKWGKSVWVLSGTESRSTPSTLQPDGITDIPIAFTEIREKYDDHDQHATIECKRIAGSSTDLCRLYVVQGIDRFKMGKYAGRHVYGFMAGYVLSGDPQSAAHGINRYLTGKERLDDHLQSCTIRDDPWARSSVHQRPNSTVPITLHHAFLSLRLAPS